MPAVAALRRRERGGNLEQLALELAAAVQPWGGETVVTEGVGGPVSPWSIERAVGCAARGAAGLPPDFRYHDLRHYFASC